MSYEFVDPKDFFELLYENDEFCTHLGKVMLAAGQLESNLKDYLERKGIREGYGSRSTLGALVRVLKQNGLLTKNGEMHFDDLTIKRNYIAHSIYDLFTERIEETLLPREKLLEIDVEYFQENIEILAQDFLRFAQNVMSLEIEAETIL